MRYFTVCRFFNPILEDREVLTPGVYLTFSEVLADFTVKLIGEYEDFFVYEATPKV
jgi:hypothetical protein